MNSNAFRHIADRTLLQNLDATVRVDCGTTARMLGEIGEVDRLRLYLGEGHPSMYAYCVNVLNMSPDIAYKRIRVARAPGGSRRFTSWLLKAGCISVPS